MFELNVGEKVVPLKWGTWAMKRACELANLEGPAAFFGWFGNSKFDFQQVKILLQAGAESANRGPVDYTEHDYGDWIDACGGLFVDKGPLVDYVSYIMSTTLANITPLPNETEPEKKSEIVSQ